MGERKQSNTGTPLIVCFPFIGDFIGGSHFSSLGLIQNLDRSRYSPLVVLHERDGPVAEMFRKEGTQFETAPVSNRLERAGPRNAKALFNIARTVPALVKFLKERKVDIVHTNDGRTHILWGLAARLAGSKHLWYHRGDAASFGLRYIASWLPNRLVAVSKFASPLPGFMSAASRCLVINSPFDIEKMVSLDRAAARKTVLAETGLPRETKLIGYVGTLVDRKRPIVFVEAIAALKRLAPDLKIAGLMLGNAFNGLDKVASARAKELGVEDCVHLLGFRYPGEPWIAALDVLLVPAANEPLGRTLVEAMVLGTPVIAADSGGNPEAIEDGKTGKLVRTDAPEEFARACLDLFEEPASLKMMVEEACRQARARFSTARHVNSVTKVYEELVA